jgi:tetratricopeptide (TPR) repeat protein
MEAEVAAAPLDAFRRAHLGLLYAYLGRNEEALRAAQRAVELMPVTKDGYDGTFIAALHALIHARSGRVDDAIAMVERLLVTPGPVMPFYEASLTLTELRTRWQWAPLREHPRAQKLFAGTEPATAY